MSFSSSVLTLEIDDNIATLNSNDLGEAMQAFM